MELETPIKVGTLHIPPQNILRKSWIKKFCVLFNASNHGIQRIELFESEESYFKQNSSKIIPLTDCIKVSSFPQKHQSNVFEIRTKSNDYQFSAETFQYMSEWLSSLQSVAFGKTHTACVPSLETFKEERLEENSLYSSIGETEIYTVKILPTEAALRNNLSNYYRFIITSINFSLAEICSQEKVGRVLLSWAYRHIRRYGCHGDNFSFEAGRKCISGEGIFSFATNEGNEIFKTVDSHMAILKSNLLQKHNISQNEMAFLSQDNNNFMQESFDTNFINSGVNQVKEDKASLLKGLPPVQKPPRKNKINLPEISANIPFESNSENSPVNQNDEIKSKFYYTQLSYTEYENPSNYYHNDYIDDSMSKLEIRDASKPVPETLNSFSSEKSLFTSQISNMHSGTYGKIRPIRNSTNDKVIKECQLKCKSRTNNIPNIHSNFSSSSGSYDPCPEHFVENNAEYALVIKKKEA